MDKTKTVRGLFLTHDISNYGASRSLQLLLNNYRDIHIDLIVRKNLFRKDVSIQDIRSRFGPHIAVIARHYLPFDHCYKYRPDNSCKITLQRIINRIVWRATRSRVYDIIEKGNYDFIHLNSLVLHPVITPGYPFVIHMRDIYDQSSLHALINVKKAKGVIFIDETTREPFLNVSLSHSIVLNNPFDMTLLNEYTKRHFNWPERDFTKRIIFSIIGGVTEKKGVDFIIRSFMKLRNDNARLLIVGRGEKDYESLCRRIALQDKRIIFWGEERDILKIYSISDYILRGEEYQCIGRTIYEGLYASCQVIIPAEVVNRKPMFEFDTFKQAIHFYQPRNEHELSDLLKRLSLIKVRKLSFYSNVDVYVRQFHQFILGLINNA